MSIKPRVVIPYVLQIILIILFLFLYFMPHFEGKVPKQGDLVQAEGMSKELKLYFEKEDRSIMWTNSMFGGMPSFQIYGLKHNNYLVHTQKFFSLFMEQWSAPSIIATGIISFYLMFLLLGFNSWLSLIGALFFGFNTVNMILIDAGHPSKLYALCYSPLVIAGILLCFKEKYIIGAMIFALGFGLNVGSNHIQMTYYLGLCVGILLIIYLAKAIQNKDNSRLPFIKSISVLGIGAILAIGSSASSLWPTYEYGQETMRGKPILAADAKTEAAASSSTTDGLGWEYAMQWSNGGRDLLASFIPLAVGGGSGEWVDKNSPLAKAVGQRKSFQAPTYWGALPFTSGPMYFGAVVVFLFVFGAFALRGSIKWWLVSSVLLTLLLSLGKNFELLNRLIFDYLPLYNKFRTPNSILSVTTIFLPILGVLAIKEVIETEDRSRFIKPLYIATSFIVGLSLILCLFGGMIFDFKATGDEQYAQIKDALLDQRAYMLTQSSLRTIGFVLATSLVIYLYLKSKISNLILILVIGFFGLLDLVTVDLNYFNKKNFVTPSKLKEEYTPRPVDLQILQDSSLYYRVYDATINTFNSASSSYFHKTIGGYHPAKLQRYQDLIDRHITNNNQAVLNMLNTKYFIFNAQDGQPTTQLNSNALGNAWFVENLKIVENANAEIDSLTKIDPLKTAFVHKEFANYISGVKTDRNGSINLTKYAPDALEYESKAEAEKFAVFSEMWYGPNLGWQAYIDGKPVEHIRVNYALRGMRVPPGEHKIKFEFKPQSFVLGNKISLISSLLILILFVFGLIRESFNLGLFKKTIPQI
jgi:hypothetical protein